MDLWQTEKQIYDLETSYLESTAVRLRPWVLTVLNAVCAKAVGNVLKGWEAMLGLRASTTGANQNRKKGSVLRFIFHASLMAGLTGIRESERLFSRSSATYEKVILLLFVLIDRT